MLEFPCPVEPKRAVDVFVTPPLPTDAAFSSLRPSRQHCANLHFEVVPHFTERAIRVADSEVLYPSRNRRVEPFDHRLCWHRATSGNDFADLRFDCEPGFLLRG